MLEKRTLKIKDNKGIEREVVFNIHSYKSSNNYEEDNYRAAIFADFFNNKRKLLFIDLLEEKSEKSLKEKINKLLDRYYYPEYSNIIETLEKKPCKVSNEVVINRKLIKFLGFLAP